MKRKTFFLIFLCTTIMPLQAYVVSFAVWKLPNGTQVAVLGDAHASGAQGKEHADVLEQQIGRWAAAHKKTLLLLEAWEDFPEYDYLYEKQIFQKYDLNQNNTLLAVRQKFYDCRQCGKVEALFCDRRTATLISCFDVLNGSWRKNKGAVNLLKQIENEDQSNNQFVTSFDQSTQVARADMGCLNAAEYAIVQKCLDEVDRQVYQMRDFFSHVHSTVLIKNLVELARTRRVSKNLEYEVADVGFITELFKQKNHYKNIVIFVGYLHGFSINKALQELNAQALFKVGATDADSYDFEALGKGHLAHLLNTCF